MSPIISIPSSFSISTLIILPSSLADIQVGCFKLLIIISLLTMPFCSTVKLSSSDSSLDSSLDSSFVYLSVDSSVKFSNY